MTLSPIELAGIFAGLLLLALGIGLFALSRARRERRDAESFARAVAQEAHLPATLHPVIDPDVCIGSLACVKACPEGDIIGIVRGAGTLIEGSACIGHGRCAAECPVDAIKLVFGTAERGVDLPEVDELFESSRPGVHVIGELGGMGLIRNAMIQGVEAGTWLGSSLGASTSDGGYDVLIAGAGPAGIACGLALKQAGLRFLILEQEKSGGAIASYPRQKLVMTERVTLPLAGRFGKARMSKEELLEALHEIVAEHQLPIHTGVRLEGLDGSDGAFTAQTTAGPIRARKVVLATGRRGTPRKLGVPGEDLPHVTSRLVDPEQYAGAEVLVVGGGDSAIEAALQLAEAGAKTTVAYRGAAFGKARAANKAAIAGKIASGAVRARFSSELIEVRRGEVALTTGTIRADWVIAAIGGTLPLELLQRTGVGLKRYHGEAPGRHEAAEAVAGAVRSRPARGKRNRWLAPVLWAAAIAVLFVLARAGFDYYPLSAGARAKHPAHALLRSSGAWGHGVGLVATVFMLSNFLYPLRKRWRALSKAGAIRSWLTFHVFVGLMSPLVIAFHAAFQSRNLLATATSVALVVVAGTGIIGRFLYTLVPSHEGKLVELSELRARFDRLRAELSVDRVRRVLGQLAELALADPTAESGVLALPVEGVRWRLALNHAHRSGALDAEMLEALDGARKLRTQIGFARGLRRLLGWWRVLHVTLAVFLVGAIALHVGVSLYLGYGWGWGKG